MRSSRCAAPHSLVLVEQPEDMRVDALRHIGSALDAGEGRGEGWGMEEGVGGREGRWEEEVGTRRCADLLCFIEARGGGRIDSRNE